MNNNKLRIYLLAIGLVLLACGSAAAQQKPRRQTAHVNITQMGYEPATVRLKKGIPAAITFLRTTDKTCATEVLFPDYGINQQLPLNEPVTIRLTPTRAGEFAFTCGMRMQRGKLIVQ